MFAKFDYRLTKEEYSRGSQIVATALNLLDRKRIYSCLLLLAIIVLAIALATQFFPGTLDAIMMAFMIIALPTAIMQVQWARRMRDLTFDAEAAEATITFGADGIVRTQPRAEQRWSWNAVRRLYDLPELIVLQFAGWNYVVLPGRLWADADERSKFVDQVRQLSPELLPDVAGIKSRPTKSDVLLIFGSVAAGLAFIILTKGALFFWGLDLCDCEVRRSLVGQAANVGIFAGSLVVIGLTFSLLRRLRKTAPWLAKSIAIALIVPLTLLLLAGLIRRLI